MPPYHGREQANSSAMSTEERRSAIEAEIERIRKRCDIKYHVSSGSVAMKGHLKKLEKDDSSEAEEIDAQLKRHIAVDSEDEKKVRHYEVSTNIGLSNKKHGASNAFDQLE